MASCRFIDNGFVNEQIDGALILRIDKLRALGLRDPLIGLAGDVCSECDKCSTCPKEFELIKDPAQKDWTVAVTSLSFS